MPTYEYGCEACGKKWELEQRITEAPQKTCQHCGKEEAKRLISGGNFLLKGGGWYADGYSSSKGSAKSDGDSSAKSEKKSEAAGSEKKSEAASSASGE